LAVGENYDRNGFWTLARRELRRLEIAYFHAGPQWRRATMLECFRLIDSDAHVLEPADMFEKCPFECYEASRILWPDTPYERLYPYLYFFDTEVGFRGWFEFLSG
jgi:hypothetical protein